MNIACMAWKSIVKALSELSSGIIFKTGMGEVKLGLGGTAVT